MELLLTEAMILPHICREIVNTLQGSCTGLEFKVSFENSLNFGKLKKSLNCFEKEWKALKSLEIVYWLSPIDAYKKLT